jgi:hypothetical protein
MDWGSIKMIFLLIRLVYSLMNLAGLLITGYLAKIAYTTGNFIAFNFMLYLMLILAFHWVYKLLQIVKGNRNNSRYKYIVAYLSFVSFSSLFFIISQWYIVDNLQLKNFYKNFQGNFTQALKK